MKDILKYPLVVLFMGFVFIFSVADELVPDRDFSPLENRALAKPPAFVLKDVINNEFSQKYEDFVDDQIIFRDAFINLKSRVELLLTKIENNGIILGNDDFLFTKAFTINEKNLEKNTEILQEFSKKHKKTLTFMLLPTSSAVYPEKLPFSPPQLDENIYFDRVFEKISQNSNIIDMRLIFNEQKEQKELYFKTDHHWSLFGARLAYVEYAEQKKLQQFDFNEDTLIAQAGFLGTSYVKSKYFAAKPDILFYYNLANTLTLEGKELPIYDLEKFKSYDKYAGFLQGNNSFLTVKGDGEGKVLVIKDSFANSFIPFLTASYKQIDVVDLRFYKLKVNELIKEQQYQDILVLYNFANFTNDTDLGRLNFV